MNYVESSLEEMIDYLATAKSETVTKMRQFHKNKGNNDVVEKIDNARKYVKLLKLRQQIKLLEEKLDEIGCKYLKK